MHHPPIGRIPADPPAATSAGAGERAAADA
jgi:hypothetical protein